MAERALAKIKSHSTGGAGYARYIGSLRDLPPARELEPELNREPPARPEREDSFGHGEGGVDDEREHVWGWNVPSFVADDGYGIWETAGGRAMLERHSLALSAHHLGLGPPAPETAEKLTAEEKRENLVAHFSALADLEERRRKGLSHFRLILSVGREVSIEELKELVNAYLRENFPLCPAFVAVHDDTEHRHAHVYVQARQLDGRLINLGQDYFKLDESWMRVCAEHLGNPEIYRVHTELKEGTLGWKAEEKKAREKGEALPPKPDRWADHHDTLLVFRPFDDRWCGRLQAQARVAEMKVAWLEATRERAEDVAAARAAAATLRERLDSATERRSNSKRESKRRMPPEVITVREARELKDYERDLLREVERGKDTNRRKTNRTERMATQAFLSFDEQSAGREGQIGFDVKTPPKLEHSISVAARPQALNVPKNPGSEREAAGEVLESMSPGTMPSSDEAARIFGRELVGEARLGYIEVRLSAERSRQAKVGIKRELSEARREYEQIHQAGEISRSVLTAQKAGEPPYQLTADERSYLNVISRFVREPLRERIAGEVARAEIIPDRNEGVVRQPEELAPRKKIPLLQKAAVEPRPAAEKSQSAFAVEDTQPNEYRREEKVPGGLLSPPIPSPPPQSLLSSPISPPEIVVSQTLPDNDAGQLIVNLELARARTIFLQSEERNLAAMPHRWVSPVCRMSLQSVEEQIKDKSEQKKDVAGLIKMREQLQSELAGERRTLPHKLTEAESEVKTLSACLAGEVSARKAAGISLPVPRFTGEQLLELLGHAEASRDTQLLERIYKIESRQALDDARVADDPRIIRRLEEKYAGLELKAKIASHQEEKSLALARKHPTEILLPARDKEGRDVVASLADYEPRKGLRGALGQLIESQGRRGMREQLEGAKESYLRHLGSTDEAASAYHGTLWTLTKNCHEMSRGYGWESPATPALTTGEIAEIRAYAVRQPEGIGKHWLKQCAESQLLSDRQNAKPSRVRNSADETATRLEESERQEKIRQQLEEGRRTLERMVRVPLRDDIPREAPQPPTPERSDPEKPKRSGGGRGSR